MVRKGSKRTSRKGSRKVSRKLRLVKIVKSPIKEKKYMAVFEKDGRTKSTHFGASGYSDYNKHKDPVRRQRYIARHKSRENWSDPTTAGALSYYLLWGPTTSLKTNISKFKRRFKL